MLTVVDEQRRVRVEQLVAQGATDQIGRLGNKVELGGRDVDADGAGVERP